jgi:hypothetical protein
VVLRHVLDEFCPGGLAAFGHKIGFADDVNRMPDSNETNNTLSQTIQVLWQPELSTKTKFCFASVFRTKTKSYLNKDCLAVVFVSTRKGFGLPIIEMRAARRRVITSRRRAMSDIAAALLVSPSNKNAATRQIAGDATEMMIDHVQIIR